MIRKRVLEFKPSKVETDTCVVIWPGLSDLSMIVPFCIKLAISWVNSLADIKIDSTIRLFLLFVETVDSQQGGTLGGPSPSSE